MRASLGGVPPNKGMKLRSPVNFRASQLIPGVRRLRIDRSWAASNQRSASMMNTRKVIVHIATSADGYVARPDGDLGWLTSRPAPEGFYGMNAFMQSIDTKVLGRKTYEVSLRLGAKFDSKGRNIVFSRHARPVGAPSGVEFVSEAPSALVSRLRAEPGKDIWLMGGG